MTQTLATMTSETLTEMMGFEVPPMYVVVAKHRVMGLSQGDIAKILGVESTEVEELESNEQYKQVKAVISVKNAEMLANQSANWDSLEEIYLNKLLKRAEYEKDSEFILKAATMANRAIRKNGNQAKVLDPASRQGTTAITLTQRLVSKINKHGGSIAEETRTISISDGTMGTVSFDEVDDMLNVSNQPMQTREIQQAQDSSRISFEELDEEMKKGQ